MPNTTKEKNKNGKANATRNNSKNYNKKVVKNNNKPEVKNNKKIIEANEKVIEENVKVKEIKPVVKKEKKGKNEKLEKLLNNTPFVIAASISIILLAALIFTLCIKKIPKTKDGDEIIASVNGKTITAEELYQELKTANGSSTLIDMIDEYIANKEATVTDEDKEYVQEVVDYYKEYAEYYGVDLETFLTSYVGLSNITTEDEFYDFVLNDYKKTIAVRKFIGDNASEEDLKAYYEENFTDKLTVKHILIEVDADAEDTDAAEEEAYNKAVKLIKKLKDTDEDKLDDKFEELAEDNSDDTSTYSNGGLISDFTKSDVVEEFWDASEALKDGEFTEEPVKTTYGYHIILKVSSTEREEYKDIKDEVKLEYAESALDNDSTLFTAKWYELRKQYKLDIEDDEVKAYYKQTIKDALDVDVDEEETEEETETEE